MKLVRDRTPANTAKTATNQFSSLTLRMNATLAKTIESAVIAMRVPWIGDLVFLCILILDPVSHPRSTTCGAGIDVKHVSLVPKDLSNLEGYGSEIDNISTAPWARVPVFLLEL